MLSVPVIDLGGAGSPDGRRRLAASIDEALHDVGFMAVTGHGIDDGLMTAMFTAMAEFFGLPSDVKLRAAPQDPSSPRGYSYVGATAQANAHGVATAADLVETFNAGLDPVPDTAYYRDAAEFFTPSIWPAAPAGLPAIWERYRSAMQALVERIMALMAEALGLDAGWFAPLIDRPMASITVNHYPALDHEPAANQFRGGAHTDYGTITLLATDGVPGLQLRDTDGSWAPTDPVPGAFHVNVGDMLEHWSGGHWRSTWHRVVPPPGGPPYPERTSIAYFHSPNADALISPLPGLDAAGYDGFEPIVAGRYLRAKLDRYYEARTARLG
ncbi:MAG: 2-oxoglutarate and iron-dependent oxygenase domain-containing protein [Ilumatobacteraceae bacterium]